MAVCKPINVGKKGKARQDSKISSNSSKINEPSEPRTQLELELINITKDHEVRKAPLVD